MASGAWLDYRSTAAPDAASGQTVEIRERGGNIYVTPTPFFGVVDMRKLAALLILLAASCSSAPAVPGGPPPGTDDASRNYLLESAAADFHEHGPAPSRFRNVRYGVVEGAGGGSMPLICGEFQTVAKGEEWIAFATLQTSKYEQWIGGQGKGFCDRPAFGWDKEDLSAELQKRLDALE